MPGPIPAFLPRRKTEPGKRTAGFFCFVWLWVALTGGVCAFPPGHFLVTSSFPVDITGGSITQFSEQGIRLVSFGIYQLLDPGKMAMDNEGNLLIADSYAGDIKKFTPSGEYTGSLGNGHLIVAACVDVGPDDKVYVGDRIRGEIRVFDASGEYLGAFGGDILLDTAEIKVSDGGWILVGDTMAGYVRVFSPEQQLVGSIPRISPGTFAVDEDGFVYLPGQDTIDKYDLTGEPVETIHTGESRIVSAIEVDGVGNMALLDFLEGVLRVYGPDGSLLREFGGDLYRYANDVLIIP